MLQQTTTRLSRAAPTSLRAAVAKPSKAPRVHCRGLLDDLISRTMGNAQGSTPSSGWQPRGPDTPRKISKAGYDITPMSEEERKAAAKELPQMSQYVCMQHGTERAFSGKTVNGYSHDNKNEGTYVCALGGLPLFTKSTKFDSGTGWPSFFQPISSDHLLEIKDTSIPMMTRTEVVDARSGAHLGHVFNDGPPPTGKRYCMNAAALKFIPRGEEMPPESQPVEKQQQQQQA